MAQNVDNEKGGKTASNFERKVETATESLNQGMDKFTKSFDKGFDKVSKSIDKGIDTFSNKFDEAITNFDEEKFEENLQNFFVKIGKGIVTFFTVILPKFVKRVFAFFNISMPKIFESDAWGFVAPLLFIIIALVIIVAIASGLRNWLFS